jgi:hypothetical protein
MTSLTSAYNAHIRRMPLHNIPNLLPNPLLPVMLPRPTRRNEYNLYTPSLFVILRGLKVAKRSYLGFHGEVFSSASISDVQEGGFASAASERYNDAREHAIDIRDLGNSRINTAYEPLP